MNWIRKKNDLEELIKEMYQEVYATNLWRYLAVRAMEEKKIETGDVLILELNILVNEQQAIAIELINRKAFQYSIKIKVPNLQIK